MENSRLLESRRILVTAGPTWVPIDKVRVITTIFTGNTGLSIARACTNAGAEVTLFMGPGSAEVSEQDEEMMLIQPFWYFHELALMLKTALEDVKYDAIIHSAAVADYAPAEINDEKIPSGYEELQITLKPTPKLTHLIRHYAPETYLVQFKLETGKTEEELIESAWNSLTENRADLVVANLLEGITETSHKALLINPSREIITVNDKAQLVEKLIETIANDIK